MEGDEKDSESEITTDYDSEGRNSKIKEQVRVRTYETNRQSSLFLKLTHLELLAMLQSLLIKVNAV